MQLSDKDLLVRKPAISGRVEIVRSFSYKLNAGHYESRDFFCSQKAECEAEDAEATSELLYEFCKREVLRAVAVYIKLMDEQRQPAARRSA